jgi:hypothetical protein
VRPHALDVPGERQHDRSGDEGANAGERQRRHVGEHALADHVEGAEGDLDEHQREMHAAVAVGGASVHPGPSRGAVHGYQGNAIAWPCTAPCDESAGECI